MKGRNWAMEQADHDEKNMKQHYKEAVTKEDAERYWQIVPTSAPSNVVPLAA